MKKVNRKKYLLDIPFVGIGASRGIGRGIALQLAKSGATVYITGRKLEDLKRCAEEMKQEGGPHVLPLQGESKMKQIFRFAFSIKQVLMF